MPVLQAVPAASTHTMLKQRVRDLTRRISTDLADDRPSGGWGTEPLVRCSALGAADGTEPLVRWGARAASGTGCSCKGHMLKSAPCWILPIGGIAAPLARCASAGL